MKKIGITGGIGSGKSVVCDVFKMLGVPVFDSDFEAKNMYYKPEIINELVAVFGSEILDHNLKIDFKKISSIVFADMQKLQIINKIIHPKLAIIFENWCAKHQQNKYIIKEAAVMIESGAHKQCDELILVTSPIKMRINRVMARNNISYDDVQNRINKQMSDNDKLPFVKHIINNNEEELLIPQILKLHYYYTL